MASTQQVSHQIFHPTTTFSRFRRRSTTAARINDMALPPFKANLAHNSLKIDKHSKSAIRSVSQFNCRMQRSTVVDVERLVDFLYKYLPHMFDDQGIDRTTYDEHVKFRDPITKHESLSGYMFNIAFLKILFRPQLQLLWVKQVRVYSFNQNFKCVMFFKLLQFNHVGFL